MCNICAGSICAGTGGCAVVINHAPEVIKITYSYTGGLLSTIQTYTGALLVATKEHLRNALTYLQITKS